ncbi:MAG: class I SAM-dependent methyltransferase [Defluviitaleaceae bacterium]|nr:class I SAM-dependent methyltransferase [Defluviitaleaceae bacterium]
MRYYIFGAGLFGINCYHLLKQDYDIIAFIDNDKHKIGTSIIDNKRVISVDELAHLKEEYFVFITGTYAHEMSNQLEEMGITNYSFYPCYEYMHGYENKELGQRLDKGCRVLFKKIKSLNPDTLNISDYNKKYLRSKGWAQIFVYARILYTVLMENPNPDTILDYGGGTGLLSLLALELGIPNVYYNDIYEVSVDDAREIATACGYTRAGYVAGDIDKVIDYCSKHKTTFDVVASYDVLEHIYDLRTFFNDLKKTLSRDFVVCMKTGANTYNKEIYDNLAIGHLKIDSLSRNHEYGHKERDSLNAFFDIRLHIIHCHINENNLSINEIEAIGLAYTTRGYIKEDICNCVELYAKTGKVDPRDFIGAFEFNTCDPLTGNWQEHIIDYEKLTKTCESLGYNTKILFDVDKSTSMTLQLVLANKMIF